MQPYLLALDQGTTSSRSLLFTAEGAVLASTQEAITQHYPQPGWVEHDPMEILYSQYRTMRSSVEQAGISPTQIAGIGITNQRETVVVWERASGRPIYPAIVWQCRRTADLCEKLKREGRTQPIRQKTGLLIDAYFSATKIRWILEQVEGARSRAESGELLCGTIDSWLIWNLTKGAVHVSDYSNCSRTMLFDIHKLCWDEELCELLQIPMGMLPTPVPNSMEYGRVAQGVEALEAFAGIPICAAAGDQQAALFGQGCFAKGQSKNTYGTGCFTLLNTGTTPISSQHGLLTSVGWSVGGETAYILEGSVFNAGSTIKWLRDELGLIETAAECDRLAESVPDNGGVYFVPAFTGMGAPYWDMYARGTLLGLTRGSNKAHLCRAVLEGIAYQTADLMGAMARDAREPIPKLRVDGGASVSDILMQIQADLLQIPVERPSMVEVTAWGAACLAGLSCGIWSDMAQLGEKLVIGRTFLPQTSMEDCYKKWQEAVRRASGWEHSPLQA